MNLGRIWDEDYCEDGNTKFIDNINYLPMRLVDLPKAFGLKNISDKSSFSYLFNTRKNQSYISPIPNSRYYSPDQMKSKERVRFTKWHEEMIHANFIFNFQHEIVNCRNDVEILRRAWCLKKFFWNTVISMSNPFEECITIASSCMKCIFRKNFLHEKEIGIIPSDIEMRINNREKP